MVRAENRATFAFRAIGSDIIQLGNSFGLLDSSMGRAASAFMTTIHLLISLKAVMDGAAVAQAAHAAATAGSAVAQTGAATATVMNTTALGAYTTTATVATGATHSLSVALNSLGGPIGLIIGIATAIGALAWATNQAASAQRSLNDATDKYSGRNLPTILRAMTKEEADLLRQGVETP